MALIIIGIIQIALLMFLAFMVYAIGEKIAEKEK
jgi:hypothetical protein